MSFSEEFRKKMQQKLSQAVNSETNKNNVQQKINLIKKICNNFTKCYDEINATNHFFEYLLRKGVYLISGTKYTDWKDPKINKKPTNDVEEYISKVDRFQSCKSNGAFDSDEQFFLLVFGLADKIDTFLKNKNNGAWEEHKKQLAKKISEETPERPFPRKKDLNQQVNKKNIGTLKKHIETIENNFDLYYNRKTASDSLNVYMLKKSFELRFNESYDAYRKKNSIRNSITIKVKQENIHNGVKVSNKDEDNLPINKKAVTSGKKRLHALKIYRVRLKCQYSSKRQKKNSQGELLELIFKLIDEINKRASGNKWTNLKKKLGKKIFDITPNYPAMEIKVTTSPKIVLGYIKQIIGFYNKYFKFYEDFKVTEKFIKVIEKIEVYFAKNGANPLVYFETTGKKIPLKDHWKGTKLVLTANILSHQPIKQNIINHLSIQENFIARNNKNAFRRFLVRILKNKAHLKLENLEKIRSFIERLRFPQDFFKEKKYNPKITLPNLIKKVELLYLKACFHEVNKKANPFLLLDGAKKIIDGYPIIELKYSNSQNTVTGCNLSPKHIYKYIYESLRKSCCTAILQKNGLKNGKNPIFKYYENLFSCSKTISAIDSLLGELEGFFRPLIKVSYFEQIYNYILKYANNQIRIVINQMIKNSNQSLDCPETTKKDLLIIIKKNLLPGPKNIIHNKNISHYIGILKLFVEYKGILTRKDYEELNKFLLSSRLVVAIEVDADKCALYYYRLLQEVFCQCLDKISNEEEKKEFQKEYKSFVKHSNTGNKKDVSVIKEKRLKCHVFILDCFHRYKKYLADDTIKKIKLIDIDKPKGDHVKAIKKQLQIIKDNYVKFLAKQPQKYEYLCNIFTKQQNIFTLKNVKLRICMRGKKPGVRKFDPKIKSTLKNKTDESNKKVALLLFEIIEERFEKLIDSIYTFTQLNNVYKEFKKENPIIKSLSKFGIEAVIKDILAKKRKNILENTFNSIKVADKKKNILFIIKDNKKKGFGDLLKAYSDEKIDNENVGNITNLLKEIKFLNDHWNNKNWILFGKFLDNKKPNGNLNALKDIWAHINAKHLKALLNVKNYQCFIEKINQCRFLKLTIEKYLELEKQSTTPLDDNMELELTGNEDVQHVITSLFKQGEDEKIISPLVKLCGTNEQNQILLANINVNNLCDILSQNDWQQKLVNFSINIEKASEIRKEKLRKLITTKIKEIISQSQNSFTLPGGLFKKLGVLCKALALETNDYCSMIFEIIHKNLVIEKLQNNHSISIINNSCKLILALGNVSKKEEIFDEISKLFAYYKLRFNRGESKKRYKDLLDNIEEIAKALVLKIPKNLSEDEYIEYAKQLFKKISAKKLNLLYIYHSNKDLCEISDEDIQIIVDFMLKKDKKDSTEQFNLLLRHRNHAKAFYKIWENVFEDKSYGQILQREDFILFTIGTIELLSDKEIKYIIKQCNELDGLKQDEKAELLKKQLFVFSEFLQYQPYTDAKLTNFLAEIIITRADELDKFPDIYIPTFEMCEKIKNNIQEAMNKNVENAILKITGHCGKIYRDKNLQEKKNAKDKDINVRNIEKERISFYSAILAKQLDFGFVKKKFEKISASLFVCNYWSKLSKEKTDLQFESFDQDKKIKYLFNDYDYICKTISVVKYDEHSFNMLLNKFELGLKGVLKTLFELIQERDINCRITKKPLTKIAGKIQFSHNLPSYEFCKKLLFLIDLIYKNFDKKYDFGEKRRKTFHKLFNDFAIAIYEIAKNSGKIYCDVIKDAVQNDKPELIKKYAFLREFFVYAVIDNIPKCAVKWFVNAGKKSIDKWKQDRKNSFNFLLTYKLDKKVKLPDKILYKKTPYGDDFDEIPICQGTDLYKKFEAAIRSNRNRFFAKKSTFEVSFEEVCKYLNSRGIKLEYYAIRKKFPMLLKIKGVEIKKIPLDKKYVNIKLDCLTVEKVETEKNAKKERKSVKKPIKTLKK
ncbi:MAG: hypothetical protein PVG30_07395 [Gammaproteobacteria bacterium]|jgi:hypothetical protein